MQAQSKGRALRGANAMRDYMNQNLAGGTPFSRAAVYRMIESGRIPVVRIGGERSEVLTTTDKIDEVLGLVEPSGDEQQSPEPASA